MPLVVHAFQEVRPEVDPAPGGEVGPVVQPHLQRHDGEMAHAVGGPGALAHAAEMVAAWDDRLVMLHLVGVAALHARHGAGLARC